MTIRFEKFDIETDGSGNWTETRAVPGGRLLQYRYVYGDMETGADLDIVCAISGAVLVNHDNLGTSSITRVPTFPAHTIGGVEVSYTGQDYDCPAVMGLISDEDIMVTIAQGGANKTGTLYIWTE